MSRKVGAPPGGRVHWFILHLKTLTRQNYRLVYDYEYHNYKLIRVLRRTLIDEFTIIRTSRRCFRCIYCNLQNRYFKYFSAQTSKGLAELIEKEVKRQLDAEKINRAYSEE